MSDDSFRFESLQIWQRAADPSSPLFKLAEKLDERRYYRFAEQLRVKQYTWFTISPNKAK